MLPGIRIGEGKEGADAYIVQHSSGGQYAVLASIPKLSCILSLGVISALKYCTARLVVQSQRYMRNETCETLAVRET